MVASFYWLDFVVSLAEYYDHFNRPAADQKYFFYSNQDGCLKMY